MWLLLQTATLERDWLPTIVSLASLIVIVGGAFKAYGVLVEKINGLGGRVTGAEAIAVKALTLAEATKEDLAESRREMMAMLWNSEKAATERSTQLQVTMARMSERLDIDALVHSVVEAVHNNSGGK